VNITILIPHYKNGPLMAYTLSQLIRYKGYHDIQIIIIDNNHEDGSLQKYCNPLWDKYIWVAPYLSDKLSSHGIAFDYAMGIVQNEWFITLESDSFPIKPGWLDYYENLINEGVDAAGSLLKLSGGTYLHPCAALYRKSIWEEAKAYVDTIPYNYYPNFMMRDNFPVHTMIHKSLVEEIADNPNDWVELSSEYKNNTKETMLKKLTHYSPVGCGVFHNGMGGRQESIKTYGSRTPESEAAYAVLTSKNQKIIGRLGHEPGQFLHYLMANWGKKIAYIPTETKWMEGKENQQQEYTINEAGIKHLWCGTSYLGLKDTAQNDIYEFKKNQIEELYNSLPEHQKINDGN
jgi:hypothetical protein